MICDYKISSLLALNAILILLKSPHPPHDLVLLNVAQLERRPTSRQGPRFSIRMVIGIFCSDTVFVQLNQFSQILSRQCCLPTSPLDHPDSEIHQYCSDNVVQILYIFCTYIAHILYRYCTYIAY